MFLTVSLMPMQILPSIWQVRKVPTTGMGLFHGLSCIEDLVQELLADCNCQIFCLSLLPFLIQSVQSWWWHARSLFCFNVFELSLDCAGLQPVCPPGASALQIPHIVIVGKSHCCRQCCWQSAVVVCFINHDKQPDL